MDNSNPLFKEGAPHPHDDEMWMEQDDQPEQHEEFPSEYLEAVRFLSGFVDPEAFRVALITKDEIGAALEAGGMLDDQPNRIAVQALVALRQKPQGQPLKKSLTPDLHALMPDGQEAATEVARGIKDEQEHSIQLDGKHSAGTALVTDPETGHHYLLKPGDSKPSPAAGIEQSGASQSRREAAFWHVVNSWGMSEHFPRADLLSIDGKEVAAIHMLPFTWEGFDEFEKRHPARVRMVLDRYRHAGLIHQWAIADYVLGNIDSHSGNAMISPEDEGYKIKLIDHGSSFAGSEFDPAHDKATFVPFYLRAWGGKGFEKLTYEQRLRQMPTLNTDADKKLREWFSGIHADQLEMLLSRYGMDPKACLDRLARLKTLASEPGNFSEAINKLWLKT